MQSIALARAIEMQWILAKPLGTPRQTIPLPLARCKLTSGVASIFQDHTMPNSSIVPPCFTVIAVEPAPKPLAVDRWIAASLLQKAIRRGEVELAKRAAVTLWHHRGDRIWSRLVIIAFEDVGLGAIPIVIETARAARVMMSASGRRSADPLAVVLSAVQSLATAPKDRCADYLISIAAHDASLGWFRAECLRLPVAERIIAAAAPDLPLSLRGVAAWTAGGLAGDSPAPFDRDVRASFFGALIDAGVPPDLVRATAAAFTVTREAIVLMLPLLWSAWSLEGQSLDLVSDRPAAAPPVNGVALWALDKHTRAGKIAIGRLTSEQGAFRTGLIKLAGSKGLADIAGMAAYYLDAAPVALRLDWPLAETLFRKGRIADMTKVGLAADLVEPLMRLIESSSDRLNALRAVVLNQILDGPQP